MKAITIRNKSSSGELLEATYLPEMGMNMISFKKDSLEVIDPGTRSLFEERYAGLGALIGPHFHHRPLESISPIKDESLFPHLKNLKAKGIQEPFSHGIARYAPWSYQATETTIEGIITGKDTWMGVPLSELEGQNFKMTFKAEMTQIGLKLNLSIVSDTDSLVGIHYYYHLPQRRGAVISQVQDHFLEKGNSKTIPTDWDFDSQQRLNFSLNTETAADYTFYPFSNPLEGKILLDAIDYKLLTTYTAPSQENCWQLYHPENSTFVCIEPISSQDPRHPNLSVSSLQIELQILAGDTIHPHGGNSL